ncbi:MAG: glycosyltransferase, partial [Bryobacteraceae bacterium]
RRPELHELMAACDSFVSLHRSEGFGLGIAEAMYLAKPVIATNYSGNVDFTKPDNSCLVDYRLVPVQEGEYLFPEGQVWADPNLEQAAAYMRRLAEDREYANEIGSNAAAFIRRQHSARATGARYARRLKQITAARAMLAAD